MHYPHRPRQCQHRGGGDAYGRLRLPDKTRRPRPPTTNGRSRARPLRIGDGKPQTAQPPRKGLALPPPRPPQPRDAGCHRHHQTSRAIGCASALARRNRRRQRSSRPLHPRAQQTPRSPICRRQLRRLHRGAIQQRTLRPQTRGLHRRARRPARPLRTSRRRNAFPR